MDLLRHLVNSAAAPATTETTAVTITVHPHAVAASRTMIATEVVATEVTTEATGDTNFGGILL